MFLARDRQAGTGLMFESKRCELQKWASALVELTSSAAYRFNVAMTRAKELLVVGALSVAHFVDYQLIQAFSADHREHEHSQGAKISTVSLQLKTDLSLAPFPD